MAANNSTEVSTKAKTKVSANSGAPAVDGVKAHSQTGPKSIAGKNRSRWNALKDGASAKSSVLPFEDERLYRRHIREVERALAPANYVEAQLVREYAEGLWRITRHEKRGVYEREKILERITAPMVADMLGLDERYIARAPAFLTNLKHKIAKRDATHASELLLLYRHLQENAKGIGNFQMVWAQYQNLFRALSAYLQQIQPGSTTVVNGLDQGLNLAWQQKPEVLLKWLDQFATHLFYVANFEQFKPTIRVWMESWFFLQKTEMRRLERDDQIVLKERNHVHSLLDRIVRIRKSQVYGNCNAKAIASVSAANQEVFIKNEMA
ncbi:hypothetical protein [Polynucleobacter sp. MWH-UH23A]|uniref:hypothetical protein n=1 Tax=Polynucleobacter sp. MWH-UH23A TaxID=1855613 RepID=UPI0033650EAE